MKSVSRRTIEHSFQNPSPLFNSACTLQSNVAAGKIPVERPFQVFDESCICTGGLAFPAGYRKDETQLLQGLSLAQVMTSMFTKTAFGHLTVGLSSCIIRLS